MVIEQHNLEEDNNVPGFRTHDLFKEDAEVRFATVHLNAMALDFRKLHVLLHHNERSVEVMRSPHTLTYGRRIATTDIFLGDSAAGDWWIEVIDDGGASVRVEWSQLMLGVLKT